MPWAVRIGIHRLRIEALVSPAQATMGDPVSSAPPRLTDEQDPGNPNDEDGRKEPRAIRGACEALPVDALKVVPSAEHRVDPPK